MQGQMIDEIEFFRCEECKKLTVVSQMREIKVRNIIFPITLCEKCFKKIGGDSDDRKSAIGTNESGEGEDRKV